MNRNKYLARLGLSLAVSASMALNAAPIANAAELSQAHNAAQIHYGVISESDIALLRGLFDAEYYKKTNPDVVNSLGDNADKLFEHFVKCGLFEGRSLNQNFNVSAYASAYEDLSKVFGSDIISYYRHYALIGAKENRTITTLKAAADAGITVTSVADNSIVIKPEVVHAAEKSGETDLAKVEASLIKPQPYEPSNESSSSSNNSSSSTPAKTDTKEESKDSSKDSSSEVDDTEEPSAEASVSLNKSSLSFKFNDSNPETEQLTVSTSGFKSPKITWESSNTDIVTVDSNGLVTAGGSVGDATITVTVTEGSVTKTATCSVTVETAYSPAPIEKYTVTFAANGGSGTMEAVTDATSPYTLPACTFTAPEGKEFDGWSKTGAEGAKITATEIELTGDTTLTAIWKDASEPVTEYTVSFEANGGSGTMEAVPEATTPYTLPSCGFSAPDGMEFDGWSSTGADGEKITTETIDLTGATTLTALWKAAAPATYTVSFEANGGGGTMDAVPEATTPYTLPSCGFSAPDGMEFDGWSSTGADGEKITTETIDLTGATTLTALWKEASTEGPTNEQEP